MKLKGSVMVVRIVRFGFSAVLLCITLSLPSVAGSEPKSPTASELPEKIDSLWQASSRKFDSQRAAVLDHVKSVVDQGPFRADWESLRSYAVPDWYRDAKFGIFIHWGVYSVPAFGSEWYPRDMYREDSDEYKHHLATYGPVDKFGYKDFIPMFKAEHFDPAAWARLFADSGAKYVIPVFEHHDGFAMYDSGLSDWTAAKMGPHRDLAGDLAKAIRSQGLRLGASFHRIEHDFFFDVGRTIKSDVNDPNYASFYGPAHSRLANPKDTPVADDFTFVSQAWTDDWLSRSAEIVDKYHPDVMWFDWWIGHPAARAAVARFAAFYYNESLKYSGTAGIINYKYFAMEEHSAVLDLERGQLAGIRQLPWQTDTSVGNKSWGYIENETFKSPEFIVHQLVDIVSKNGNLLLNIGPRADGTISDDVQRILLDVGGWLKMNGEAIYGTRAWRVFGEGPTQTVTGPFHDTETQAYTAEDFRFTQKDGVLYAVEMAWPTKATTVIHSLKTGALGGDKNVKGVRLLGTNAALSFQQLPDGLHVDLPLQPVGSYAYVLRVELANGD